MGRGKTVLASAVLRALGHEPHPSVSTDPAFEELASIVDAGVGERIDYTLDVPKVDFLQWLRRTRDVVFHGSVRDGIDLLRPVRETHDKGAFGDQQAVYASDDPVWAMYFAVLRRRGLRFTKNSCTRVVGDGRDRLPRYAFAINDGATMDDRLGPGVVYVLPREPFEAERPILGVIDTCHWVGFGEIAPLASIAVTPDDFPFARSIFTMKRGGELRMTAAHWRARLHRRVRGDA